MSELVPQQSVDAFNRDGAVVLRGVFKDWVETLRAGVDDNMEHPNPAARIYTDPETGGTFLSDYCNWDRIPQYKEFIFNSPAAEIGSALMEKDQVQLFHEHVLVKTAKTGIPTPWHQDQPYYCVEAERTLSLWIPLDPVSRDRTLEFLAGSHSWGKLYRPQRFDGSPLNENDGLDDIPNVAADRDAFPILGWAVEPGDAVAFDYRTVHGAPANTSPDLQRRAFSLRLVGGDARFMRPEGRVTSPPFPDVTLTSGSPLSGPEFPILKSA